MVPKDKILDGKQTCRLIDSSLLTVSLANLNIDTPYYSGQVKAMLMEKPLYDIVIGNIDGARQASDPDPDWSEAGAVTTRAQAKKSALPPKELKVPSWMDSLDDPSIFQKAQIEDPSLKSLHQQARDGVVRTNHKGKVVELKFKRGLLYRSFHSPTVRNDRVFTQLVVPRLYRTTVMKFAHECIFAGHMGRRKTADRLLADFYWPGIYGDVANFCRSCEICQKTTPKGMTPKHPLGVMPLISTPFERVAIDLVGPISPPTEEGHRYIITLMDYATRYPEAIPLKRADTPVVAEALLDMFSRLGIPAEVLSDKGTQFLSELMAEVSRLLSFHQLTTTPYHPMCNGLVEKFNGTLKQMLRRMCAERPKDWNRYVSSALFAYREAPQESLGFSPFELVYGRSVRGPMSILKECWSKDVPDPDVKTTYQYVLDLRERLERTCAWAQENLKAAASRHKAYFDQKTRRRTLSVDDKVLVLLPTNNNKLLMHWKGPYVVKECVGDMDYRVEMAGKTKTLHINMLKKFVERQPEMSCIVDHRSSEEVNFEPAVLGSVAVVQEDDEDPRDEGDELPTYAPSVNDTKGETPNDVHISDELTDEQKQQVKDLLYEFSDVLTDRPGLTSSLFHDIKVTSEKPVRVRQYPIPYSLLDVIDKEIAMMLEMGVIEKTDSPYSAPVVLVKKKDGTNRFCVDFRALNGITVFDPEPIPSMETIINRLAGKQYFSKFDLTKGYWQVPLTESAKIKSSFSVPSGHYRFTVMPFGQVNAPATFSRLMRIVLDGLKNVDNYIDDTIAATVEWDEHLSSIRDFLMRLRHHKLTAKPSKCYVGFRRLECFAHEVGFNSQRPHESKISAIEEAPAPTTKKGLRAFLGLVGFYRKFVPNFAEIALPLTDLTKKGQPSKLRWGDPQEKAFLGLKKSLICAPVLRLPDVQKRFTLRTDASDRGLGAVLLQEEGEYLWPIAYASKKLLPRESNYSTIEKECLAVVWGIMKFAKFLYGVPFILQTDHQPLQYLLARKATNSRLLRRSLVLQPYRFTVQYIRGKDNVGADYLSRVDY